MIARVWRAQAATTGNGDAYVRHFDESVRPALAAVAGHRGALLLRREVDTDAWTELMVITLWDSMEAIATFAGKDPSRAVIEPAARAVLSDSDVFVEHYEVVVDTRSPAIPDA